MAAHRPSHAPLLGGAGIVVIAGMAIGGALLRGDAGGGAARPAATPAVAVAPAGTATARYTVKVRAAPDRFAAVIAILPGERATQPTGRTADRGWVEIAPAPGVASAGWVLAEALVLATDAIATLPVRAVGGGAAPADGKPDLEIAQALLMPGGMLAVSIRNVGEAPLVDARLPLDVSTLAGEIVGVLDVGPATLAPGGSVTVVTSLVITRTGSYLLELDRTRTIAESRTANNARTVLLVTSGGPGGQ